MADQVEIFQNGVRRFRIGGFAIAVLPLILALGSFLAGGREAALSMLILALILLMLVLWLTHCAETIVQDIAKK